MSHLSIHDANNRFITVHQTNDTVVRDVVGYNTFGHGFFIEDGVEENNLFGEFYKKLMSILIYRQVNPPSSGIRAPFINFALSLAKKITK